MKGCSVELRVSDSQMNAWIWRVYDTGKARRVMADDRYAMQCLVTAEQPQTVSGPSSPWYCLFTSSEVFLSVDVVDWTQQNCLHPVDHLTYDRYAVPEKQPLSASHSVHSCLFPVHSLSDDVIWDFFSPTYALCLACSCSTSFHKPVTFVHRLCLLFARGGQTWMGLPGILKTAHSYFHHLTIKPPIHREYWR